MFWRILRFTDFNFGLMNYGMANRVGPVFSVKTKNASTHHEIEYAVLIK